MAEAIREVVASAILFKAADPRIRDVTVLRVEVTGDLRQATVYVSIMGTEAEQAQALRALKHAAGFFQSKVADRLQTRFTPVLGFKVDDSVKKSVAMGRLIEEALASDRKAGPADPAPPAGVDEGDQDEDDDEDAPDATPEGDGPHGGVAADPS
jgi:ribosome-binding factor A